MKKIIRNIITNIKKVYEEAKWYIGSVIGCFIIGWEENYEEES
jgi:hypothetical protein